MSDPIDSPCRLCGRAHAPGPCANAGNLDETLEMRHALAGPPSEGAELSPGEILDGRYQVAGVIGEGAMGTVYAGHHVLLGRPVAIKIVRLAYAQLAEMDARFLAEGRVLASLAHPHVVQIHDLGVARGMPYLVMERLEGDTLHARIARGGPLPIAEARLIARQVLAAISAVHRAGIVHRDIKPANVFLCASRDRVPHAKLLDFGVSTRVVADLTRLVGTPSYLAPEQVSYEVVDARTDVWAMGITLYEMLTGTVPFKAPGLTALAASILVDTPQPPSALRADVPPQLDALVMRALEKYAKDRFQTAAEMLDALTDEESPVTTRTPSRSFALIADPDPRTADLYASLASELDLIPVIAGDGAEAIELLTSVGIPRLVVVDLGLPVIDGFALVSRLRALAPPQAVAVVAVSALRVLRAAARERRAALGFAAVLDPRTPRDLFQNALQRACAGAPIDVAEGTSDEGREKRRLARIDAMQLVNDAPADGSLQQLVEQTARAFDVPVALISLMLRDRQWYMAHVGLQGELLAQRSATRSLTFCQHVVESAAPLVVPDARRHPVFADNPSVLDGSVGSYAGAPLVTPGGEVLGTLCIFDSAARPIGRDRVDDLVVLARRVAGELEVRGAPYVRSGSSTRTRLMAVVANIDSAVLLVGPDRRVIFANPQLADLAGLDVAALLSLSRDACFARLAEGFADPADFLRRTRVPPDGPFAGREDLTAVRPAPRRVRWTAKPADIEGSIGHLETFTELAG